MPTPIKKGQVTPSAWGGGPLPAAGEQSLTGELDQIVYYRL